MALPHWQRCALSFFAIFFFTSYVIDARAVKPGSPVILVPGDGGSQFYAKLNKSSVVHYWCKQVTEDYFSLWLNLEELAPYVLDCFVDNMKLVYDKKTRTTHNSPGVDIVIPSFGNTSALEFLDPSKLSPTTYYALVVKAMLKWGYTRNVNIKGAPYDFRKAPNEASVFMKNFTRLVEDTYRENGNQKVVLIAHSMGNLYTQYLLYNKPQAWKDKFIKSWVAISAPWGGAAKTLRLFASGDNLDIFVVNPLSLRKEQRSMPSTAWMLPYDTFWHPNEILVSRPDRNYTVNDYKQFFTDLSYPEGWMMREDTEPLLKKFEPPNVEIHCLHGIGMPTPAAFTYKNNDWPDTQPTVTNSDGDGTVNKRSLHGCLRWTKRQKQNIFHQEYNKTDHMSILGDDNLISYIKKVLYM